MDLVKWVAGASHNTHDTYLLQREKTFDIREEYFYPTNIQNLFYHLRSFVYNIANSNK